MDGNVKRVLSRVLAWGEDLSIRTHERALIAAAQAVLPLRTQVMPSYTQGLMDLGATLCTPRKPACLMCPWSDLCVRAPSGRARTPIRSRPASSSAASARTGGCGCNGRTRFWLQQMPDKGVWAGLWTMPLLDGDEAVASLLGSALSSQVERQPRMKHVLTHLDWWLHPRRVVLAADEIKRLEPLLREADASGRWVALADLANWGLPAPLRRLLVG